MAGLAKELVGTNVDEVDEQLTKKNDAVETSVNIKWFIFILTSRSTNRRPEYRTAQKQWDLSRLHNALTNSRSGQRFGVTSCSAPPLIFATARHISLLLQAGALSRASQIAKPIDASA